LYAPALCPDWLNASIRRNRGLVDGTFAWVADYHLTVRKPK
jgi:hypothetical protein